MLNSVSGVNFRGNPILEREGKYTQSQQPQAKAPEMPADSVETTQKKKHKGLKATLWTIGILAAAAIGLGVAAKTGKLSSIEAPEGMMAKAKNVCAKIGEGVADAYDNVVAWGANLINKIRGKE